LLFIQDKVLPQKQAKAKNQTAKIKVSAPANASSKKRPPLSLRWWSFYAVIVAFIGGISIRFVLTQIYPVPAPGLPLPQILLFALIFITIAAGAIPVIAYFNHRFATKTWRKRDPARLPRQALGVGLVCTILAYLQMLQALDWMMAAVVMGVFILIETFFVTRS
jgi:hypothetical protein